MPSTPTKPPSLPIHSTPHSQGSGSHYSYHSRNLQEHYKPYLKEDLKHKRTITFDAFLNEVLHLSTDWIERNASHIRGIVDTKPFLAMISKYCEPMAHETHRYSPFIVLANHVVGKLAHNSESNLSFCRNDPIHVRGSSGQRKPDVVGVIWRCLQLAARSSVDNLMKDGPNGQPFWWTELLAFLEFKLNRYDLSDFVGRNVQTRDQSSTVVPSTSQPSSSSESKSRKRTTPRTDPPSRTMITRSGSRPSSTSASGSKRISPAMSSDTPHKSKKLKAEGESLADDSMLQCASYALEILSHGGLRSHVIGALVTDDTIELLYYDRSIVIVSEPLNFIKDQPRFIAVLQALASLSLQQWGYAANVLKPAPLLDNPLRTTDIFDGLELNLCNGSRLRLGGTVFHQHGLIGRGTCVVRATCIEKGNGVSDEAWNGQLIVKLSWPARSRMSEQVIIEQARSKADNDEHRWVLKHLPKVLHAEDVDANLLSQALIDRLGDGYEARILRMMVQEELFPITERVTAADLAESFREIFQCYRWLYEYAGIVHRDISLDNLMLRKEGDKVYGVLNDMDLAVTVGVESASSKQRTGTKPFMAIDLLQLEPPVHMYRHDLESMFYVLVWITSRFHDGKEIVDASLQEWADEGGLALVSEKYRFIMSEPPQPTSKFYPLGRWVVSLHKMMRNGFSARTEYSSELAVAVRSKAAYPSTFEDETLGGFVTFDKFQAILDAKL